MDISKCAVYLKNIAKGLANQTKTSATTLNSRTPFNASGPTVGNTSDDRAQELCLHDILTVLDLILRVTRAFCDHGRREISRICRCAKRLLRSGPGIVDRWPQTNSLDVVLFPQIAGLGSSAMAQQFAITTIDEARRYLEYPVLGHRLRECTNLILASHEENIDPILGYPDNLKFRSCLTLFATAAPQEPLFAMALDKYFRDEKERAT